MKGPIMAALLAGAVTAAPAAAADLDALKAEGGALIKSYAETMMKELKTAMETGGPVNAIGVCNQRAPAISTAISQQSGWQVARTSHRLRNPNSAPDAFEQKVLADFLARIEKGEKAADLVQAAVVEADGAKEFRLVKAIPTAELCLNCHGSDLKPEVAAKLKELYPTDRATGFAVGQMRGVFTLSKRL